MSEAPPDKPTDVPAEKKSEVAAAEPTKDAPAPAASALAEAAKATGEAEKKAESAAPVAAPIAAPAAMPIAPAPSPAANTSGMHLQYVAPGVRRQSMFESTKWQIALVSAFGVAMFFMMFRGSINDLSGKPAGGGDLLGPAPSMTTALGDQPATDDSYQPLANRMPAADLTVNAGAIGGSNPTTVTAHGDAGVNKGGYADERADLDTAEAMVPKDPDKALALVDKHDKDYPRGILDPDARIIRIEAFQKKGDDVKALSLADEFLQDYPHSPRAGRVQSIAEQIKNKTGGGAGNATP